MSILNMVSEEGLFALGMGFGTLSVYSFCRALPKFIIQPINQILLKYQGHIRNLYTAGFYQGDSQDFVLAQILVFFFGCILILLMEGGLVLAIISMGLLTGIPYLMLRLRIKRRRVKFSRQLEEMLVLMGHTVRVHPSMLEAVKSAAYAMEPPVKEELNLVLSEVRLGADIVDSLDKMVKRMPSTDLEMALSAIRISRQVGSDLSAMLDQVVHTLREVNRLENLIDSKTSAGKLQARIMMAIPICLMVGMYIFQPDYILPVFENPIGWIVLALVLSMQLLAAYMLSKFSTLHV